MSNDLLMYEKHKARGFVSSYHQAKKTIFHSVHLFKHPNVEGNIRR